jgi:protein farnesyltransferase subunit beta
LPHGIDTLYNREGLARYILACSQSKTGGLRDKPGKYVIFTRVLSPTNSGSQTQVAYYALIGLSNLQYYHYHTDAASNTGLGGTFASSFSWESISMRSEIEDEGDQFLDGIDRLKAFHPIYSIPHQAAKDIRLWAQAQASL